jgi:lysozyme family protein
MDPRDVDVQLEETAPEAKITSYTEALSDLGRMTEVFATGVARIQCSDIADNTGTSMTTGGEIQKNITEIMKSTLNSMGGNIVFIEYDPSFIQNQMVTGYSNFESKVIPDVVITGGITEFDRGLETRDTGVDAAASASFSGVPSWAPSNEVSANFGNTGKTGKARITLDFNMKDFTTLAGVPKMTTTNSMEVNKAVKQKELGITLFGPTFGLKGAIKKVQGRHEAVRLLVQVSMIQMVGKYMAVPYWRLLGEDSLPDQIVVDSVIANYYNLSPAFRIALAQQWLFVYGFDVKLTGKIDAKTLAALQKVNPNFPADSRELSEQDFVNLYLNMPFNAAALGRRNALNNIINQAVAEQQEPEVTPEPVAYQEPASTQQQAAPAEPAAIQAEAPAAPAMGDNNFKSSGFGRKLNESEW